MKAILMSIKPKYCELIANGKKTVEVRKTKPKIDVPFKCYIYATRPKNWFRFSSFGYASDESLWLSNGKVKMCDGFEFWADETEYCCLNGRVIGEFVCDYVTGLKADNMIQAYYNNTKETCLTDEEIKQYANGAKLYYWHISDLVIYDKPKELGEFKYIKCTNKKNGCDGCEIKPNCIKKVTRPPQSWQFIETWGD